MASDDVEMKVKLEIPELPHEESAAFQLECMRTILDRIAAGLDRLCDIMEGK